MTCKSVVEESNEVVLNVLRDTNMHTENYRQAMREIPEVLDCVEIDRVRIYKETKKALGEHSFNFLYAFRPLFRLFGLEIIDITKFDGKRDKITGKGKTLQGSDIRYMDGVSTKELLFVNTSKLEQRVKILADLLLKQEKADENEKQLLRKRNSEIGSENEKTFDKLNSQIATFMNQRENIVKDIQSQMCLIGKAESSNNQMLNALLSDMRLTAVWPDDNTDLSVNSMFTVLKTDDLRHDKPSPCIMCNEEIVCKGLKFVPA